MKTFSPLYVLGALLVAVACSRPDRDAREKASQEQSHADGAECSASYGPSPLAPMEVRVAGPAQVGPGSVVEVEIQVVRQRPTADPIDLAVRLPPGAVLLSGAERERIRDTTSRLITRTVRVRIDRVPAEDLRVSAEVVGLGYGVHARAAYRFGRPAPKLVQPVREQRPVIIGHHDLGRPIPLRP